jgi:RNA polymerase sigma-70 factor, ECF subfamily
MTNPLPDETLAIQARVDKNAFAELYQRHAIRVYRYHLIQTGNVKDAEDLTSQTFLAALGAIRQYRRAGSFAAWLMGIARRQKALLFRRRRPEMPLENVRDLPATFSSTELTVARRISFQQAYAGLQKIGSERAEAIVLYVFGGLSLAETAQTLGKSEAAVKMLISRGLEDLRTRTLLALEVEA